MTPYNDGETGDYSSMDETSHWGKLPSMKHLETSHWGKLPSMKHLETSHWGKLPSMKHHETSHWGKLPSMKHRCIVQLVHICLKLLKKS